LRGKNQTDGKVFGGKRGKLLAGGKKLFAGKKKLSLNNSVGVGPNRGGGKKKTRSSEDQHLWKVQLKPGISDGEGAGSGKPIGNVLGKQRGPNKEMRRRGELLVVPVGSVGKVIPLQGGVPKRGLCKEPSCKTEAEFRQGGGGNARQKEGRREKKQVSL